MINLFQKLFRPRPALQPVMFNNYSSTQTMGYSKALKEAYNNMPETFHATQYINTVRRLSGTRAFDSTILRALRFLRKKEPIKYSYTCIDHSEAIYKKVNLN